MISVAGVHPHDAKSMIEEDMWGDLHEIAAAPECVAVGECGLNYSKDFSEPHVQRDVFKRQVTLCIHAYSYTYAHTHTDTHSHAHILFEEY